MVDGMASSRIPALKPSAYPLAQRPAAGPATVVTVGSVQIGGPRPVVIAGPCAVESADQLLATA